jgi:hypothetical protein
VTGEPTYQCRDCGRLLLSAEVRMPYSAEEAARLGVSPADELCEGCIAQRRADREAGE